MTAPGATAATQSAGNAAFADPAKVDAAHRTIRGDSAIQFDLPWHTPEPPPQIPRWLRELFDALGNFVNWVGDGWTVLMWLAIGAAVLVVALVSFPPLREWLSARLARREEAGEAQRWKPDVTLARALLDEADRLAAAGYYAQAVRLILHRSIEDIEKWRGDPLRPSLTSRDIARFDGLPDAARTVFRRIVADVERSLFGGKPLGRDDWTRARSDYAAFALGQRA